MKPEEKLFIIQEGQRIGVQKACAAHGISRTLYYRWLNRYETQGVRGLEAIKRQFTPTHKISDEMEGRILDLIRQCPDYGPRELKYQLEQLSIKLSESAVYNVMKRHGLSTKAQRLKFSHKRKLEVQEPLMAFDQYASGECWVFWITYYGSFEKLGELYEYTIMDFASRIACSRLYTRRHVDLAAELITAVALPIAQSLSFDTKHLFLIDQPSDIKNIKTKLPQQIHRLVQNVGIDLDIQILDKKSVPQSFEQLRAEYTQRCLSHLMPFLNQCESLSLVRYHLQTYIRAYNLTLPMLQSKSGLAPIAYHTQTTNHKIVLPLWAYIERDY